MAFISTVATARCFFSKTLDALGATADDKYLDLDDSLRQALVVGRPITQPQPPVDQNGAGNKRASFLSLPAARYPINPPEKLTCLTRGFRSKPVLSNGQNLFATRKTETHSRRSCLGVHIAEGHSSLAFRSATSLSI